eukprot:1150935-Pelagomonas_calceolata.AAC.8
MSRRGHGGGCGNKGGMTPLRHASAARPVRWRSWSTSCSSALTLGVANFIASCNRCASSSENTDESGILFSPSPPCTCKSTEGHMSA